MFKYIVIIFFSLFIAACQTQIKPEPLQSSSVEIQYIDLTDEENALLFNQYWIIDKRVNPYYPINAAKNSESGCTELIVGINPDGKAAHMKVVKSYPEGVFDGEAIKAVSKWRWQAAAENIDKKAVLTRIQLEFLIKGERDDKQRKEICGPIELK